MNFELTEEQQQIKYSVREFAESEIRPHVMEWDETQHFPEELRPKLAELGLMGVLFPEEYGGAGMGYVEYATIIEELGRVCGSVGLSVAAHNSLCSNHIYMFGTEEQKQKYLVPLARGESFGAWGLTESQAGSDSAGTRTNAIRSNGGWKVNGSKNFITHAIACNTLVAVAVTDKAKGNRGISAFIFDKSMEGFRSDKKENKLGMRASETASVVFEDCYVPDENLLGNEGEGFLQGMQVLDGGRISIAALSVGIAQGAYEAAVKYAKERQQFGKPIAEFQAIQFKLADMATQIECCAAADAAGRGDKRRRQDRRRKSLRWQSCMRRRSRCASRKNRSRSTAATAIRKTIRPRNTGAIRSSAPSAKARPRSSGSSLPSIC